MIKLNFFKKEDKEYFHKILEKTDFTKQYKIYKFDNLILLITRWRKHGVFSCYIPKIRFLNKEKHMKNNNY